MFNQYVVCSKRAGGTAIIAIEEWETYSPFRKSLEFLLSIMMKTPADEAKALRKFPRLKPVIEAAHSFGLGPKASKKNSRR